MPPVFIGSDAMQQHLNQPVRQMFMTKPGMRSFFRYRHYCSLIAAAYLVVLAPAWSNAGYLPTVGPSPLRFRPAFKPNTNIVVLPIPIQPVVAPPPAEKVEKVSSPTLPALEPIPAIAQTNAVVEPPRPDVVSPQMLLKYFNKPTNGNAAGVSAPLDFTPPRPVEPPSSKASYSTPQH